MYVAWYMRSCQMFVQYLWSKYPMQGQTLSVCAHITKFMVQVCMQFIDSQFCSSQWQIQAFSEVSVETPFCFLMFHYVITCNKVACAVRHRSGIREPQEHTAQCRHS